MAGKAMLWPTDLYELLGPIVSGVFDGLYIAARATPPGPDTTSLDEYDFANTLVPRPPKPVRGMCRIMFLFQYWVLLKYTLPNCRTAFIFTLHCSISKCYVAPNR